MINICEVTPNVFRLSFSKNDQKKRLRLKRLAIVYRDTVLATTCCLSYVLNKH